MKKKIYLFTFLLLLLAFSVNTLAQTPQYYNYNTGTSANSFPFNVAGGKEVQWLVLAHEFNQPSVAPPGTITAIYFRMAGAGTHLFTDLLVKFGLTTITSLPAGVIYTGPMDTVYFKDTVTLSSTASAWMVMQLTRPFVYDTSKSLVIDVSQCGYTGSGTMTVYQTSLTPVRRCYINGTTSCVFTYSGQDGSIANCGVDITPAPTGTFYFSQWCPANTFPNIPALSIYGSAAVLGDTLYMAIASTDGATASNLVYRYSIVSHAWSTGTPLPTALAQATLTKCGSKLYHIGGGSTIGGAGVTSTYEYDPTTGQWTTKASMPTGKNGHSTVCWGDSVLIVFNGPWGAPDATVYCFRPALNTWATCTSFSGGLNVRSQAGGIVGNKIFSAGGYPFTNQLVIGTIGSNAQTITWAAGPPFPSVPKSRLGGVGLTDRFYIIGGNNSVGTVSSDSTFVYNIYSNAWTPFASVKPTQVHNVSSCVVKWGTDSIRVACLGGTNNSVSSTNVFEVIGCGVCIYGNPREK